MYIINVILKKINNHTNLTIKSSPLLHHILFHPGIKIDAMLKKELELIVIRNWIIKIQQNFFRNKLDE